MKRMTLVIAALLGGIFLAAPAFAHGGGGGYGMGPGMMGGGGGGYGMGPGLMGGGGGGYGMGPGMMGGGGGGYGMGPGMMGGGFGMGSGMMGGGFGMGPGMHPELAQLPEDKREQLRKFHFNMMREMIRKRADLQVNLLALRETMSGFPLDQKKARQQWAAVDEARKGLFDLRLSGMATVQGIVGKELWESMHAGGPFENGGHGPGTGSTPGMTGPGMMGPQGRR